MANSVDITRRIFDSVLAKKLLPGARLGEQQLALVFGCSRTIVREALTRLAERGIVTVNGGRGWQVVELSYEQAVEAFEARQVLETGLLRLKKCPTGPGLLRLRDHITRQQDALTGDAGTRSLLLGDFHVCLAECLGNGLLADTLRDLTARTMLIAMRYQSDHDAARSCAEHAQIVEALEAGNMPRAEQLMSDHLGTWNLKLPVPPADDAPSQLNQLRQALEPMAPAVQAGSSSPNPFTHPSTFSGEAS